MSENSTKVSVCVVEDNELIKRCDVEVENLEDRHIEVLVDGVLEEIVHADGIRTEET